MSNIDMIEQLRQAIRDSGRTLADIGEASGVDKGRLSRFMRGQRGLTFEAAAEVCKELGLRLSK